MFFLHPNWLQFREGIVDEIGDGLILLCESNEPTSYKTAVTCPDSAHWLVACWSRSPPQLVRILNKSFGRNTPGYSEY